jgi:hypothetical protein
MNGDVEPMTWIKKYFKEGDRPMNRMEDVSTQQRELLKINEKNSIRR